MKISRLLSVWILASCMTLSAFAEQRNLAVGSKTVDANENRVALVIGNSAYRYSPLKNPANDSHAMSAKLKTLGFEVIERDNLTQRQVGAVLREFRSRLKPGSVALFFYAGHGLQVKGVNYLPTVDAEIAGEEDVPMQSMNLNQVLEMMEEAKTRMNLVFLDACRNNPYASSFRSTNNGLSKVNAPSGTL
ncbi:MAG: caspase family protein, partial [Burkholderiaceae bacterium]